MANIFRISVFGFNQTYHNATNPSWLLSSRQARWAD